MAVPPVIVDPAPGPAVLLYRKTFVGHLTVATGGTATRRTQHVGPLPVNAIVRRVAIIHDSTGTGLANTEYDVLLTDGDDGPQTGNYPAGTSIFDVEKVDLGGPGWTTNEYPFFVVNQVLPEFFPNLVIVEPNKFLALAGIRTAAGAWAACLVAEVDVYDRPPLVGGSGIIPRGTEVDPLCVRICPTDGGADGGAGGGPGGPPPPPPPPPPAAGADPATRPLPPPCNIDVADPLNVTLFVCSVP